MIDAVLDPWPPFTFCCPQAIVDQDAGVSIPNSSPFPRSTRLPFTSTASPPAPLAIRKAPSPSVESIEPRPPRPCEVGRPKGRRRKNRRQSHNFFLAPAAPTTAGAAKGWSAQALPPGVRWPKNRVVGFLGEGSENFFERCPSDCLTSARLTLPATRWLASEYLSTFSGDSPRAVAIAWKMRRNCVRSRAPPFWDGRP